jgi:hypothetical protein
MPDKVKDDDIEIVKEGEPQDDLIIETVDDTPPEDRGRPKRGPDRKSAIPDDDEIGQYTENVQKRIKQMKWEYHEERRAKEAALRENNAAVEMAKRIAAENQRLRQLVEQGHKTMLESNKTAAESELGALRESLRAALEAGETAKAAELQEKISRAAARAVSIEQTQPIKFEPQTDEQPQAPAQQQVQISRTMRDWMDDNPWFNRDRRMTSYAFGVHDELLEKHGPGYAESPAYFKAINDEMRKTFPDYFGTSNTTHQPSRTVAAATRTNADTSKPRGPKKVTLTLSEQAVAKKLGITPEAYAREKARMMEQENG